MADTITEARTTPDVEQSESGLTPDEYAGIREMLGRRPTSSEAAMYALMWSDRFSFVSSNEHMKKLGDVPSVTTRGTELEVVGTNGGVVDIGRGYAAAVLAGGCGLVRDVLAQGARPLGVLGSLRLGLPDDPDTQRVLPGVVTGITEQSNGFGLPTIGVDVVFDTAYATTPFANALYVGVLRPGDLRYPRAAPSGSQVMLLCTPAGRGSDELYNNKVMIECTLELLAAGLIDGLQEIGSAGLACALSKLAGTAQGGVRVDLDAVAPAVSGPLEASSSAEELSPEDVLTRGPLPHMVAIVEPAHLERVKEICRPWDIGVTAVGEITEEDRLVARWHGEPVVDVDPATITNGAPARERRFSRPDWIDEVNANDASTLSRNNSPAALRASLLRVITSPNACDTSWITDQFDRYVRANTVLAQPENVGMLRIDPESNLGIASSTVGSGRMAYLNPYLGAQLSLVTAYRNVAAAGAEPLIITDCLNFGSSEDPVVMWQLVESVLGLADGCKELGTPVAGSNVAFANRTGEPAIPPTPTVGVIGVIDDVATRIGIAFADPGDEIWMIGTTKAELSGSVWADVMHDGHLGGMPPTVDIDLEKRLAAAMVAAARSGVLRSAHAVADGGLAQALVASCLRRGFGAEIDLGTEQAATPLLAPSATPLLAPATPALPSGFDATTELYAESTARVLVSLPRDKVGQLRALADKHQLPLRRLGSVTTSGPRAKLNFKGLFNVPLTELRDAWAGTLPAAMADLIDTET